VKNYVLKNFPNIQAARFQTSAAARRTVAPNTTEAGRQLNRRTDIKVVLARSRRWPGVRLPARAQVSAARMTSLLLGFVMPRWCSGLVHRVVRRPRAPDFLPSPSEVVRGTLQLFIEHDLASAILVSTKRIGIAFLLASALALPLGVLMGAFERSTSCSSPSWRRALHADLGVHPPADSLVRDL